MASGATVVGWIAVTFVALVLTVDLGQAQPATCHSESTFGCNGPSNSVRVSGSDCCNDGYLAFQESGNDVCQLCPGNVVCSDTSDCSTPFDPANTQSRGTCCATGGGVAYTASSGNCIQCPSDIISCNTELSCGGDSIPLTSTGAAAQVRECCVDTAGLSYNILGQCFDCTVFGFLQTRMEQAERGQGFPLEIGYIKRPPSLNQLVRGQINVQSGTAVNEQDFSLSSTLFTARPNTPAEIIVTYRVDSIAQEFTETATASLSFTSTPPIGTIVQGSLELVITDSDIVSFRLTETDYQSSEMEERINAVVSKNMRIANPVTISLTPLTIDQAVAGGVVLPTGTPPDNNRFSPNRARVSPEDRRDFSSDIISMTFLADEIGTQINDIPSPVPIIDDEINEASEELFIVFLALVNSINPGGTEITRNASLCRISDNDEIRIGFQNASYTFTEPLVETEIFGEVFIEKEDGRLSEQTFPVVFDVRAATPNTAIRPASLSTIVDGVVVDNDYVITLPDRVFVVVEFSPDEQLFDFSFTLFPDELPEGTEAFQASAQPSGDPLAPNFLAPSAGVLFPSTFIIIEDNDDIRIGFEQNYTVPEGVGSFMACFRVFNPLDDQELTLSVDLVVDTEEGSAGVGDFIPISSDSLDVFITLSGDNRRGCFEVSIIDDIIQESTETFSLLLSLDQFVPEGVQDQVDLDPAVVFVNIIDNDVTVRFEEPAYTFEEDTISEVCLIKDLATTDTVTVQVTTADITATDGDDYLGGPFSVTFGSGANDRQCIDVSILADNIVEVTETFSGAIVISPGDANFVQLGVPPTTLINIVDGNIATVRFEEPEYSFDEDVGTGEVCLIKDLVTPNSVTVQVTTADITATDGDDYVGGPFTVTFGSGANDRQCIDVSILGDDIVEVTETFSGAIVISPGDASFVRLGVPPTTLVNILDINIVSVRFEEPEYSFREDVGTGQVCLIKDLATPNTVTVQVTTADITATDGDDYVGGPFSVTFGSGANDRQCIDVTIIEDNIVEVTETFSGAIVISPGDTSFVQLGVPPTTLVNILDTNIATVRFEEPEYSFREDVGTGEVCLIKDLVTPDSVTVQVTTADITATDGDDYVGGPFTVTFGSGANDRQCIDVTIIADNIVEVTETFSGAIVISPGDTDFVQLGVPPTTLVNILDANIATVRFEEPEYSFGEDVGTGQVCLIKDLVTPDTVTVQVTTADITATDGDDYEGGPFSVTFGSGANDRQCIDITIIADNIVEVTETFSGAIVISPGDTDFVQLGIPPTTLVNILDANIVSVRFEEPEYSFREDVGTGQVCLIKDLVTPDSVTVQVTTADITATDGDDYVGGPFTVTFGSGANDRQCIDITIIADNIVEVTETFSGAIVISPGDTDFVQLGVPPTTLVNILDDNIATVRFEEPEYTFNEGSGTGQVCLIKDLATPDTVTVQVTTADITATDGDDYEGGPFSVTFESGANDRQCIDITIIADNIVEVTETFSGAIVISPGDTSFVQLGVPPTTLVNIIDNNIATVRFEEPEYTFNEDTIGQVCLIKDLVTPDTVTVQVTTADITATDGDDYEGGPFSVTFGSGANDRQCIDVSILGDDIVEVTETFSGAIVISSGDASFVQLGVPPTTLVNIIDNDFTTVRFEEPEYTFMENQTIGQVCLIKDLATPDSVTVMVITEDITATEGEDYEGGPFLVTFGPGANDRQCIDITILNDTIMEPPENFTAAIFIFPNDTSFVRLGDPPTTLVTILDSMHIYNMTGDPMFTVPLMVSEDTLSHFKTNQLYLCYEVHGGNDMYFNLVTDECLSVNGLFTAVAPKIDVVTQVGIRAIDSNGDCSLITVDRDGCSVNVNGVEIFGDYSSGDVTIERSGDSVMIGAPNCGESVLMQLRCTGRGLEKGNVEYINMVIMRGQGMEGRRAHGLIGQFWKVPVEVDTFSGQLTDPKFSSANRYTVSFSREDSGETTSFTGLLQDQTWNKEPFPCLYAGDRQGGAIFEVVEPNDPVVEGSYKDYIVSSMFSEKDFVFGLFDEAKCPDKNN